MIIERDRQKILSVNKLTVKFNKDGKFVPVVENLSYSVNDGEILAIIGESGSGKTVTVMSILGLLRGKNVKIDGTAMYGSTQLLSSGRKKLQKIRGNEISIIFQNPSTSLNPSFTVHSQLRDVYRSTSREQADRRIDEVFEMVGLQKRLLKAYPHMLSGGQKQRVVICMAIINRPKLLILDEATTALDVTIQLQILNLLLKLRDELNFSMIFITHDIGVVSRLADKVLVMYRGMCVEYGSVEDIFYRPSMPYTQLLLASVPTWSKKYTDTDRLSTISGQITPYNPEDKRCIFIDRCPKKMKICDAQPSLIAVDDRHISRCHLNNREMMQSNTR